MKRCSGRVTPFMAVAVLLLSFTGFSGDDNVPVDILTKKNPVSLSDAVMAKAKGAYVQNCLTCHGPGGKGDGPMSGMVSKKPGDLTDSKLAGEMTDGEIFWIITKGKDPMPPFGSKISEPERWGLVHLMRTISNSKANTSPSKTQVRHD